LRLWLKVPRVGCLVAGFLGADVILFLIGWVSVAWGCCVDEMEANSLRTKVILGFLGVNLLNLKMCGGSWNVGGACSEGHGGRSEGHGGRSEGRGGRSEGKVDSFYGSVRGRNLGRFSWNSGVLS
jgi:hypothetical protein